MEEQIGRGEGAVWFEVMARVVQPAEQQEVSPRNSAPCVASGSSTRDTSLSLLGGGLGRALVVGWGVWDAPMPPAHWAG